MNRERPDPGPGAGASEPCEVVLADGQTLPLVIASPHSGHGYLPEFLAQSPLDPRALRKSEDSYVDELFAAGPALGAPLLRAHFPRIYVDPNREPFELDPRMFEDKVPDFVNASSPRVAAGLGTIARLAAGGEDIYREKLRFAEALQRIDSCYRPYHATLRRLVDATVVKFGFCILLDCHSMPSVGGPTESDAGRPRADFVLGDCFGESCAAAVTAGAERALVALGYSVRRNAPYSGGFTTRHYGRPRQAVHALQVEVNRGLYMDQDSFAKAAGFSALAARLSDFVAEMAGIDAPALMGS
ncbi:MAG TPA: N-formylglutamate amidohydrolase [Alphaproteobacteria bacterium]|nr:N-formylglutamate amidohydrolase [Alphaproteobacteria bacterium]